jgi:hypothetical protein
VTAASEPGRGVGHRTREEGSTVEIPLYRDGQWSTCPHPVTAQNGDYDELMSDAGYSRATQFHPGGDERAVSLTVWADGIDASRPGQQAAPGQPEVPHRYRVPPRRHRRDRRRGRHRGPDDLLATWTPVVQVGYVCDEAAERWMKDNT